ncbi:endopeptidase La [Sedimentisphaera salicampi]|uniref:Lon protease n=1 Tax=Sedimentisphaera salicampi TaxID=1941349 RepID=A0A1W6LJN3_9BACT|nr:endopeptidase La [Sedimentisphaera salicampi]ARN55944.1 Lon protease 2 [Sedimentisphaera salicampi]
MKKNSFDLLEMDEIDEIISEENGRHSEPPEDQQLPEEMKLLPVRNAVSFPGTVVPLAIGRDRSLALLDELDSEEEIIGLITQKKSEVENPKAKDIYDIGTAVSILKVIRSPGGGATTVIVHGLTRFRIDEVIQTDPFIKARVSRVESKGRVTKKLKAMMVNVKKMAIKVASLSPNAPEEASLVIENIDDPGSLADFVAATLNVSTKEKQEFLEEESFNKRLQKVSVSLANQLELLELSDKIHGEVRQAIDKTQREYFLQEQLKAIQSELGHDDKMQGDLNSLSEKVKNTGMPEKVESEILKDVERLKSIPQASPEYSVIRNYVEWACDLPWKIQTEDAIDIERAEQILERDHYGLKKVKKRILEFLSVRKLNPEGKSPILCLVGPPGVGKTSLGKSIANALNRKFIRISLGGMRDEAEIRGHRKTYIGAMPGRILQEIRKSGSNNPVFMLDELDKIGQDFRGDPASALLEVLDPEQNNTFTDYYLDQPFDLSNVMFIGTANYTDPIPDPLYDRMETIELPGYTQVEKLNIAKKYLVKRQVQENGLKQSQFSIRDEAINLLIEGYTSEAGVRSLERQIAAMCRAAATKVARDEAKKLTVTKKKVGEVLGPVKYESEIRNRTGKPGVATGLAWTPYGGEILFIESLSVPGKGDLTITGQIGDVMEESAKAAYSYIKSVAPKNKIDNDTFKDYDYHIHVPAGAVPKDGPSAGVGMFASLFSLVLGKKIRADLAMTGEISLQGNVLPIGGLKEKVLAAKMAGIKTVVLPYRNKKDMPEVPEEAKKDMEFVFVKRVNELKKFIFAE